MLTRHWGTSITGLVLSGSRPWQEGVPSVTTGNIRVNPPSILSYGRLAQDTFNNIRTELTKLVDDTVSVHYFGPNAVSFKTKCGQIAADFATRINQDMGSIADAVRVSTSNISGSLGGQVIHIEVSGAPITAPAVPQGDGSLDVNTAGLEGLKGTVRTRFATVTGELDQHLNALRSTDWTGNKKDETVGVVTGYTNRAKSKVSEAENAINRYISEQLQYVKEADTRA